MAKTASGKLHLVCYVRHRVGTNQAAPDKAINYVAAVCVTASNQAQI